MRPAFLVLLSWAAAVPMAAFAAAAERLGRVPPPAFAYEATEIAGTVYAGSNDGLWCLAPDGAVRVHGGGDVSTPVAFGRATLYFAADGVLWEIPAGRLDPGESPEGCARRELKEEAGYTARAVTPLTPIYTTPGFTDEVIHLFVAEGLEPGVTAREADEFMEVHELRWSEVRRLIRAGDIRDAKTLVALLLVESCKLKA